MATRSRARSASGRDVGEIPPVADPTRRTACRASFRLFCEAYFPATFHLAWSADHLWVIGLIEQVVTRGGLFAVAMPRGSGKTSLAEAACLWAALNGLRRFIVLIGASKPAAEDLLASIKTELEGNEALAEDYPEACVPIARLEGIANRCAGQHYRGERTRIVWSSEEVVLPSLAPEGWASMPGHEGFVRSDGYALCSGAVVKVTGIEGRIRGLKHKRHDGASIRPDLVIPDDPQTDESARSPSQSRTRELVLAKAVLGLAGPKTKISGIMPCTVIEHGDMADRILNRKLHPEWQGVRTRLAYSLPTSEALWARYAEIRAESLRAGNGGREATEFYRANREAMDIGAKVAWPERYNGDEASAVQHVMNLKLTSEEAFAAEYQNEPIKPVAVESQDLTPDGVMARLSRVPRGLVPMGATHLTAFIDVQGSLLYWAVCAWTSRFGGWVVDYGSYPDQHRQYYTLADARDTLEAVYPGMGLEARLHAGLQALTGRLCRQWEREGGGNQPLDRLMIDANWGESTDTVYQFCRSSPHAAIISPSHGRYVGASSLPVTAGARKDGDRLGLNWKIPGFSGKRSTRYVIHDSNFWKSFLAARLTAPLGDPSALTLNGDSSVEHRMLADHLTAEYRVRTEGRGRTVDEWKIRPTRPDNHFLDCLSGCCVAASVMGCSLTGEAAGVVTPRRKVSFAEMQRQRRAGR